MKILAAVLMILSLAACLPDQENKPSNPLGNLNKCDGCSIGKPILEE